MCKQRYLALLGLRKISQCFVHVVYELLEPTGWETTTCVNNVANVAHCFLHYVNMRAIKCHSGSLLACYLKAYRTFRTAFTRTFTSKYSHSNGYL
jgi:hypothetical protein